MKLWEMYSETKEGRIRDALDNVEAKWKYQDEIAKLNRDLKNSEDQLKQAVDEKQVTLAKAEQALVEARAELEQKKKLDASTSNMHKFLRMKAENDKEKLKEEKRKLEYMIGDLLKQKEGFRSKFRKIKEMCDE